MKSLKTPTATNPPGPPTARGWTAMKKLIDRLFEPVLNRYLKRQLAPGGLLYKPPPKVMSKAEGERIAANAAMIINREFERLTGSMRGSDL